MVDEPMRITVRVVDTNADDRQLDELTRRLREELLALDVAVDPGRAGAAPAGAKSVELAALGTLVVTLSQSPVLAAIVNAISAWLVQRRQGTVKVDVDGDVLELSGRAEPEQRPQADAWLRRHERAEPDPAGNRHALVVANYDYEDPGLRRLRAPAHDAEQLARVLRDRSIGGFDVRTVRNESAPTINETVEDFFADRSPEDLLLLYFSGHGVKDEDGELYFAAAPTKLNRLGATAVAADFVNRRMNRSRSRRIVLLLDCCYAGAFGRGMVARAGTGIALEEEFGGRGRAVITASSAMEYAFEGPDLADTRDEGPSVFTRALVDGLDTGDADRDQDGYIGLDELYDYVYERVRRATPNQTPGKWTFDLQGDLHIARRSRPVSTPAPLPRELQEAIDHPLSGMRAGAVGELARLLASRHEGLALAARLALQRLADDDSRTGSAAAGAALGAATPVVPVAAPTTADIPRQVTPGPERGPAEEPKPGEIAPSARDTPAPHPVARPPRPPGPRRQYPVRSVVIRVLAAGSAALLAVGAAGKLASLDPTYRNLRDANAVWLWLLVGAALVLVVTAPGRRARDVAQGAAFGLSAGVLGMLVNVREHVGRDNLATGFWFTAAGALLIVATVVLDMQFGLRVRRAAVNTVATALGIVGIMFALFIYITGVPAPVLSGIGVLLVAAVAVQNLRGASSRRVTALGAAATLLITIDAALRYYGESIPFTRYSSEPYLPMLVIVLLVAMIVGEDRPVALATARLSLILGLLLQVPLGPDLQVGTTPHLLLLIAAAAFTLGALNTHPAAHRRDGAPLS